MLVLSRKKSESIQIGDNITVVVVELRGDKVRLGIRAPAEVVVDREEVAHAKLRERQVADAARAGTLGALEPRFDSEDNQAHRTGPRITHTIPMASQQKQ